MALELLENRRGVSSNKTSQKTTIDLSFWYFCNYLEYLTRKAIQMKSYFRVSQSIYCGECGLLTHFASLSNTRIIRGQWSTYNVLHRQRNIKYWIKKSECITFSKLLAINCHFRSLSHHTPFKSGNKKKLLRKVGGTKITHRPYSE